MKSLFGHLDFDHHAPKPAPPAQDICSRKHGGNPASVAAFERCKLSRTPDRLAVYEWLLSKGSHGGTLKEFCEHMKQQKMKHLPHQWSGRFSELKASGLIVDSGRREDGCAVLVAVEGEK